MAGARTARGQIFERQPERKRRARTARRKSIEIFGGRTLERGIPKRYARNRGEDVAPRTFRPDPRLTQYGTQERRRA